MAEAGSIDVAIRATTDGLSSGLDAAKMMLEGSVKGFEKAGAILGAAVIAGLTAAIAMAAGFEDQINKIGSVMSDVGKSALPQFRDQILQVGIATGQSSSDLADSLFKIAQAGVPTADMMDVLAAAAKLATGGFTDMDSATQGILTLMHTWPKEFITAAEASDFLFTMQKNGRLTIEQASHSFSLFAEMGAAAGISAKDLGASLETMSMSMGGNARRAGQEMTQLLNVLANNNNEVAIRADEVGVALDFQKLKMEGLLPFIAQFNGLSEYQVNHIMGGAQAAKGLNAVLNNYKDTLDRVNRLTDAAGSTQDSFNTRMGDTSEQFKVAKESLADIAIKIGDHLLPKVNALFTAISSNKDGILAFLSSVLDKVIALVGYFDSHIVVFKAILGGAVAGGVTGALVGGVGAIPGAIFGGLAGGIGADLATQGKSNAVGSAATGGGGANTGHAKADADAKAKIADAKAWAAAEMQAAKQVKTANTDVASSFKTGWNDAYSKVFGAAKTWSSQIQAIMKGMTNALAAGFNQFFQGILLGGENLGQALMHIGTSLLDFIISTLAQMVAEWIMKHVIMAAISKIFHLGVVADQAAAGTASVIVQKATSMAMLPALLGVADAGTVAAYAWIPPPAGPIAMGAALTTVSNMFAGFGSLIAMASGGILTGPTPILAGEAGREAVIPLTGAAGRAALKEIGGGGDGGVHIHLHGALIEGNQASWERLMRNTIVPALEKNGRKTRRTRGTSW